ncbi:MAG: HAD family hydrolase [Candidatus Acetothermia bacterium]
MHTLITDVDNTIADTRKRMERSLSEIGRGGVFEGTREEFGGFHKFLSEDELDRLWRVFLSDKYVHLDRPEPDSARVLNGLVQRGIKLIYLTGRHDEGGDTMRPGTEEWLREHGFPVPGEGDVRLLMKPERRADDKVFKLRELRGLNRETNRDEARRIVGIGDMPDDASAYSQAGVEPILLDWLGLFSRDDLLNAADDVTVLNSWEEVESFVASRYLVYR